MAGVGTVDPVADRQASSSDTRRTAVNVEQTQTCNETRRGRRVLLAEDDQEMRSLLSYMLNRDGYQVLECRTGFELLQRLWVTEQVDQHTVRREPSVDLIISDNRMPGIMAMTVLEGIEKSPQFPPVILITAFGDEETHKRAYELGAVKVFDKPFDFQHMMKIVHQLLQ